MRNLVTTKDRTAQLAVPAELGDVLQFAVESDGGLLFIAGSRLGVAAYRTADCQLLWCLDLRVVLAAGGATPPPPAADIAAFDHVPELDSLCLALSSGEILLLDTSSSSSGSGGGSSSKQLPGVEEVGAVDGGLAAAAWSPDGELLVLVTGGGNLLMMNKEWELLSEVPLLQHKEQQQDPASSSGTGVDGDKQQQQLAPGSVAITWREDGRYFATASQDTPGVAGATLRVWERESGELHAEGEAAAGLLPTLAWQPNGRHLYAAVTKQQQAQQEQQPKEQQPKEHQQGGAQQQRQQQQLLEEAEQQQQAAAEGIQHVGAWKRELRRRQQQREAEAGGGTASAAASKGSSSGASGASSASSVLLFECNGLQHGGFDLPPAVAAGSGSSSVEQLAWSPDSEFLAVVLAKSDEDGLPEQVVQLWHRSNWHWYLKQERRHQCCSSLRCCWDAAAPLLLHVVTAEGDYQQLQYARQPSVSRRGTAVVVDGSALLLTPLRHTVVPPPLCAVAAAMPAPVSCLAIRDFGDCEAVAAVLSDGGIALLASVEDGLWEESLEEQLEQQPWDRPGPPKLLPQLLAVTSPALQTAAAAGSSGGSVQAAAWVDDDRLLLLVAGDSSSSSGSSSSSSSSELLIELEVDAAAGTAVEVAAVSSGVPPLLCCCSHPAGGVLLQQQGGGLLLFTSGGALLPLPAAASFPGGCQHMAALPADSTAAAAASAVAAAAGGTPPAFGLNARGQLYWGSRQLAADVTSFALRHSGPGGAFLLFTTRAHTLHTASVASLTTSSSSGGGSGNALLGAPASGAAAAAFQQQQQMQQQDFRSAMKAAMRPTGAVAAAAAGTADVNARTIEQNALLVAVPPDDVQVVLQMPRGNLEAIRPRSLVLPAVAAALDDGKYASAWHLAAANRLDLNVLVDFRWPRFIQQAALCVEQVPNDTDIADLLSALDESSTAAPGGMYAAALPAADCSSGDGGGDADAAMAELSVPETAAAAAAPGGGKVAAVCAAVRAALEQRDQSRYLRAILTSCAKCGQLEAALALVKQAKEEQLQGRQVAGAPTAEDGLRHLMLFIHDDKLYQAALGMYELELAYMVVAHSQKDPGEYLLELQQFAAVPDPHLRHHKIDMHLRRWDRALQSLVSAGEAHFADALDLAREHGLLRLLLKLEEGNLGRQQRVHAAYGEVLEGKNMHEDAGLAFIASGQLDRAISAYRSAGQWRMCFALAARVGWGPDQQRRLAAAVADDLSTAGRAADAAAVTLEYLKNVDTAVLLLAHGKEWREALRVAYGNSRTDLVETVVAPRAAQAAAALLEEINDNIERVHKYSQRLQQLRQRRSTMEAALAAADAESGIPSRQGHQQQQMDAFDDTESVADSMVSGMSVYTDNTHTGATTVGSSTLASTVGGKKQRKAKANKGKSKSSRIRRGSPQEEEQLAQHLLGLAPHAATCAEVGQLAELLVLLDHLPDAALLQQRLALLVQQQQQAAADVLAHPPPALALTLPRRQLQALQAAAGPAAAAAAAAHLASLPGAALQQRVATAEAAVREAHWKWDILREAPSSGGSSSGLTPPAAVLVAAAAPET